ncbi:MAG: TIM barrel protein [Candidatus Poribacteria bacterium]|nr:TIM barrel protein [Candidatus Poribacteria bacterium]
MKLAIRDACLKNAIDRVFDIAHNLGYRGVEMTLGGRSLREHPIWTRQGMTELRDFRNDSRIEIASLYLQRFQTFGFDDDKAIDGAQKLLNALIPRASVIEARCVFVAFRGKQAIETPKQKRQALAMLKEAAVIADAYRVTLCVGTTLSAKETLKLLDDVGSDYLKVDYDIADAVQRGENPAEALAELGGIVRQIRFRDMDAEGTIRPLGIGKIDFIPLMTYLEEAEYDGYAVIDAPPGDDPVASAAANLAFVQEQRLSV